MAEILSGLGSLFSSGGASVPPGSLGVNTAMPKMTVPTSVSPLSQQIANMSMPNLVNPMGVNKMDTTNTIDNLRSLLGNTNTTNKENAALKMMQLNAMQQPMQIQQVNLMDLLKNIGGGY
jgi:hypothetical protein